MDAFLEIKPEVFAELEAKLVSTANTAYDVTTLLDDEWDPSKKQADLNKQM